MSRREFLLASVLQAAGLRAQKMSGTPAATALSLRTASFRNRYLFAARPLEADWVRAMAYGAKLEPGGVREDAVVQMLAQLDPWTSAGSMIVDMGLLGASSPWSEMLLRLHEQFDIIEADADFSAYRLIVVPDATKADAKKLQAYRKFGGSVYTPPAGITPEALAEALRTYVPKPAVIAPGLPPEADVTFLERRTPGGIRRVGHVLYYPNDKPGVLENVQLSFRLPQHPLGVVTIPDQRPIEFVHNEFLTTFTLPKVTGHRAIAFE